MNITNKGAQMDYALGVDIGGTGTAFGAVSRSGEIVCRGSVPSTGQKTFEEFAAVLRAECERVCRQAGVWNHLVGVGVGAPAVDANGVISGAAELKWPTPINVPAALSTAFGLPARAANDANAAAVGEMMYGAARGMTDFIELTLGTGVGSGIVSNGRLLLGNHGLAGELGHIIVEPGGRQCGCGRKGCLETYCAAAGIVRTARELLEDSEAELTPKLIYNAAVQGQNWAIETFRRAGEALGTACANFVAFTAPQAIILFGGVTGAGYFLMDPLKKAFRRDLLFLYKDSVKILTSTLPSGDAAILGASALAWNL